MSIAFWISFFAAPVPAHNNTCTTAGVPLFEMRERSEIAGKPTITTRIFESGAWSVDGPFADRGCFDRQELRTIRRAVQRAPWRITTSPIACFARGTSFTEYLVHGSLRFTERMCSGKAADAQTRNAIDLVKQELAEEQAPPPVASPPVTGPVSPPPVPVPTRPPVMSPPVAACPAEGTALFEIHKRSDVAEPTSTIALYASGAWTFQPIDKTGHAGSLVTGCLDRRTMQSVRTLIEHAPWQTSMSTLVCRAYSAEYTEYYVHGQLEFTARMCGAQHLDAESLAAIHTIEDDLAKAMPSL